MNPYMGIFAIFGLVYAILGVWAMFISGSVIIPVTGIVICAYGWWYSKNHLT